MKRFIMILCCLFFLSGCGLWRSAQVPVGSAAGSLLKSDVAKAVRLQQKTHQPGCSFTITDIRVVESNDRGEIKEEWNVLACQQVTTYEVTLIPSASGSASFKVERK